MSKEQYKGNKYKIYFNRPYLTGREMENIKDAHALSHLAGNGFYTNECHNWIEKKLGVEKALLTHSCTSALEMMALMAGISSGDEVIMPSFTFVSTANAFVLRGATPVFVDIRPDTLNINEDLIEDAITSKTKAIVPVHYAGVGCNMEKIGEIAQKHGLLVLEDAAQAMLAKYKCKYLGTLGNMSALSFHETKNIISGEGGAILINDQNFVERAEIIWEKGTNRNKFLRGEVDKYTWVDIGSSYLPSEAVAAFLFAQLEESERITNRRLDIWNKYHSQLTCLEEAGCLIRPTVPQDCQHNGHIYYIRLDSLATRTGLIDFLKERGILSVFHYIPLHSSPAGKKFARFVGDMSNTDRTSDTLIRLPLYYGLKDGEIGYIVASIKEFFK